MTALPPDALDRVAQLYVDAVAERDSMSPRDAAKAAGARTDAEIDALAARIQADRDEATRRAS